jgi:hypothetical protein
VVVGVLPSCVFPGHVVQALNLVEISLHELYRVAGETLIGVSCHVSCQGSVLGHRAYGVMSFPPCVPVAINPWYCFFGMRHPGIDPVTSALMWTWAGCACNGWL